MSLINSTLNAFPSEMKTRLQGSSWSGRWDCSPWLVYTQMLFVFGVILLPAFFSCNTFTAVGQQPPGSEMTFPTTLQWNKQKGVTSYRLQIASDEEFRDIVFDTPVKGERYVANNLSSGHYFWRVTPIGSRSDTYSRPVRFFVSGGVVTWVKLSGRAS